ncbi:MAG: Ger(x)C family spore germination protein [Caulobacteraceae bacterium]
MRKTFILILLLFVAFYLSSCAQIERTRTEIDRSFIVRIISIDKGQDGKVKVTLTTKSTTSGGNGGGGGGGGGQSQQQSAESIAAEGETMFEAVRNSLTYAEKRPHFGHTEFILIGEEIAREGVLPYLDFISRQSEFRYNAKLYIVKGETANSIVKKTNTKKMFAGDRLSSIEQGIKKVSVASTVSLNEAIFIFDNKQLATFIPYLEAVNSISETEKKDLYDIKVSGYSVFNGDKLSMFLTDKESRGINFLMNRVGSGVIVVKGKNGETVSLEIVESKAKRYPKIQGDDISCTIKVSLITNIGEIEGTQAEFDEESLQYLRKQQENVVKKEIEHIISLAQEKNADFFSAVTSFGFRYPGMRDEFASQWKELFPKIKFNVEVESQVARTYLIKEPTGGKK